MAGFCPTCGGPVASIAPGAQFSLTAKQAELLGVIKDRIAKDGVAPSYDELAAAIGLKSKSGIVRLVKGLVERGHLRHEPNGIRSKQVISSRRHV